MIDIVLPCKSYTNTLPAAISSLNKWNIIEHVIIVGFLSEKQVCAMRGHSNHVIKYIRGGSSIYEAMNIGLSESTAEYIYFLGDDDQVCHMSLRLRGEVMSGVHDIICARVEKYEATTGLLKGTLPRIFIHHQFLWNFWISLGWPHQGILVRRSLHRQFDENFKIISDNVHLLKLLKNVYYLKITNEQISLFNIHGLSSNRKDRHREWLVLMIGEIKKSFRLSLLYRPWALYEFIFLLLRFFHLRLVIHRENKR